MSRTILIGVFVVFGVAFIGGGIYASVRESGAPGDVLDLVRYRPFGSLAGW